MNKLKTILFAFSFLLLAPLYSGYAQEINRDALTKSLKLLSSNAGVNTFSLNTDAIALNKKAGELSDADKKVIASYYKTHIMKESGIIAIEKGNNGTAFIKTTLDQAALDQVLYTTAMNLKKELKEAKAKGLNKNQIIKQWALSLSKSN